MCAGEPTGSSPVEVDSRVYPRVCGGTLQEFKFNYTNEGLSPCVRGNPGRPPCDISMRGSIPVCAGEPTLMRVPPRAIWVYPRVCGGTSLSCLASMVTCGLSPCVRGNLGAQDLSVEVVGSIPVCAGEPPGRSPGPRESKVYPRVCGGTALACRPPFNDQGLSPCVRGNRRFGLPDGD